MSTVIRETLFEMLKDRGYTIPRNISGNFTCNKGKFTTLVYFSTEESIGIKSLKKIAERMESTGINSTILIYKKTITSSGKAFMDKKTTTIEAFKEDDFLVNITKHELAPMYKVLSYQEKKQLVVDLHTSETLFPRIQFSDPVARWYGMKRGDVLQVVRKSETTGEAVSYRTL